jgi:tripartite-type tricarboxylate transporter receptor subunit TctC
MSNYLIRLAAALLMLCLTSLGMATAASAQTYPSKPIRVIIGFPAGAGADTLVRLVGQKLSESWGQPVLIDNKPGASSNIAAEQLVKAPADGYTLLYFPAALVVNPSLFPKVPYDLAKDFAPVALLATFPLVLVVNPALPVKSVGELIAYGKANPGKLNFASLGSASPPHLAGELFKRMAGIDAVHVPYKGSAPAQTDLISGQVQMMFDTATSALPQAKAGRTRAIAVTSAKRSPLLPELPTVAESGLKDYDLHGWAGLVAPAGTPPEILGKLQAEIARVLKLPEVIERYAAVGGEADGRTADDFRRFINEEERKWKKLVLDSGARLDQ